MRPEKKELEDRKISLQKQHDDLTVKIKQGRDALINLETTLVGLKGAIAQCDWTLGLFKEEKKK
jgi:hypothetical protein